MLLKDIFLEVTLVFVTFLAVTSGENYSSNTDKLIELGRQQYNSLMEKTKVFKYGECWKNAVGNLYEGCEELTEHVQCNIALRFTDCFLKMSGHETCDCYLYEGVTQRECMQGMSERAFNAYAGFYTHTQNICFYLKSQIWHEETENTINRLSSASDKAATQLEELVDNSMNLKQALVDSHTNLKTMMDEFQIAASEQRRLIFDVFDRLSSLQEWAVGEISWLDTVVFYLCGVIVSHILTATPRTQEARFFLFLAFTINIIAERYLCHVFINKSTERIDNLNENLSWWVWLCRKILVTVCAFILSLSILRYQDYNIMNHELLVQIQQQNLKLLGFLEKVKMLESSVSSAIPKDTEINIDSDCELLGEFTPQQIKREPETLSPSKLPASPRSTAAVLRKTEQVIESALKSSMGQLDIVHTTPRRSVSPALSQISTRSASQRRKKLNYDSESSSAKYNLRHHRPPQEEG